MRVIKLKQIIAPVVKGVSMGRQKRKPHLKASSGSAGSTKKRKEKQKTQKPKMQSVMVMGPTGKLRMEQRPW